MESYRIENLSFTYPTRCGNALNDISLSINQGEFVLICGQSGCGKTTLLRLLKPSLSPFGEIGGNIYFGERELSVCDVREQASGIGFVMQNPDNQIVTDKVWHELSFGLESLGMKTPEIRTKVSEMAAFFGIENWFHQKTAELSGGQKQLLNLAAVMVMQPSVLILDEPTSQLDPIAAQEFLNTLKKINSELGTTIILAEHRLEEAFSIADRVIVMEKGTIIANQPPKEVAQILKGKNHPMYKALPTPMRVYGAVGKNGDCPLTVCEGRMWLEEFSKENPLMPERIPTGKKEDDGDSIAIEIKDAWFRYEKNSPDVIKGLNLKVKKGEIFAILGGNGTGKTTALSLISGLNKPYRGEIYIGGENISKVKNLYDGLIGVLPQNPQSVFLKNTVWLDLMGMLSGKDLAEEEKRKKVQNIAHLCCIDDLLESHPYDLSGGEQQRAGLAKVLLLEPQILLLDEPTKGMDARFKEEFADILAELKEDGVTVIMVSHDIEFCAEFSDRCALVFDGSITSDGGSRQFFAGNRFYTTAANRMARGVLPNAVLCDDIILACGGMAAKSERKKEKPPYPPNEKKSNAKDLPFHKDVAVPKNPQEKRKLSKVTCWAILSVLLTIPLTILAGMYFFEDRKYYFISLLIIFEIMIPFCMVFESGKPRVREIVLISVLCAITVSGRAAFFMLPQFKPVAALVIIAGVCFGGETGFLVGAVSGFVSNFFFGQGPWTPWQMFSMGMIGFVSGMLFEKGMLKKARIFLCIFGFVATFLIYGGIMNLSSVLQVQASPTTEMFAAAYISGLPLDIIHAVSTAFFLCIMAEPFIEKLERIKTKYGLMR
ncbi:MAG: ATP-binding cassette domain-containing protein [Clostridia bacterium]|nr:ATP-binding cassette domain-containing protein [Clostridia bacterium]